jgi:hypothetical protein
MMQLRQRLKRLEKAHPPNGPRLWLVCVDHTGRILDDGSPDTRPWVGLHYADVPGGVAKVIMGIDPLVVLGRREPTVPARQAKGNQNCTEGPDSE